MPLSLGSTALKDLPVPRHRQTIRYLGATDPVGPMKAIRHCTTAEHGGRHAAHDVPLPTTLERGIQRVSLSDLCSLRCSTARTRNHFLAILYGTVLALFHSERISRQMVVLQTTFHFLLDEMVLVLLRYWSGSAIVKEQP